MKLLRGKLSLVAILSLSILAFGIVCMSWALINIGAQTVLPVEDELTEEKVALTEIDQPSTTMETIKTVNAVSKLYPLYPSEGDNIGSLTIPVLEQEWPIIQGTGENELKNGVGHFAQSVLPGENDNCVLSGHRDTVFSKLGKLEIGDLLIVKTSAGTFTYEIKSTRIVDKNDKTVIVPTDHAVLTLSTCYPFNFIGDAQQRYILTADLMSK